MSAFENVFQKIDWDKSADGLVPAIVQHSQSNAVLMLAWMNRQALQSTLDTGRVTFFSRSRQQLWTKGETSGNFLEFVSLVVDCDGDTLLVSARPVGPVCHTGAETCFGSPSLPAMEFLSQLQAVIDQRMQADPGSSYTAELLSGPLHRVAQKVGEEAVETILAATSRDQEALVDEAADLVYHLMVMLTAQQTNLAAVVSRLRQRHEGP
jgi:phosphoribosyl-ATP pyrophosphohydrolase/phosphoribosyl-AMP cyclohydrolase